MRVHVHAYVCIIYAILIGFYHKPHLSVKLIEN